MAVGQPLEVQVMGELAVAVGGHALTGKVASGQVRLALAFLVLERDRPVPRDELADVIWPRQVPSSWDASLRALISRVRGFLSAAGMPPDTTIHSAFGCYQLALPDAVTVDVESADAAIEHGQAQLAAGAPVAAVDAATVAVEILGRPFLAGVDVPWADRVRARLRDRCVAGHETIAEAHLAAGEAAAALVAAGEAVTLEPLRESAHRLRMRAHAASGNRAHALRAYEQCRTLLTTELGVSPSAETEALYLALLGDEPVAGPASPPTTPAGHRPVSVASEPRWPFTGRTEELRALRSSWRAATSGPTGLAVVVTGEAGIGKTRLATELAAWVADQGAAVVRGRADEDVALPYLAVSRAIGDDLARRDPASRSRLVDEHGAELAVIVPELATGGEPAGSVDHQVARYRLYEAVTDWLADLGGAGPALVVLDDLHWSGVATLHLLRHVLRTGLPPGLLLVSLARSGELDPADPVSVALTELRTAPGASHLRLAGLSEPEVAELVGDRPGRRRNLARRLHRRTGGSPLFLTEVLAELASGDDDDHVPERIRDLVALRLARLPDDVAPLIRLAAVVGETIDVGVLVEVSGHDDVTVLDAVERARAAGLLEDVGGDAVRFRHALLREAVVTDLPAPRRIRHHLAIARALEARPPGTVTAAEIAHHLGAAAGLGVHGDAAVAAGRAGDEAVAALDFERAASWYRDALAHNASATEPDPGRACDLRIALGEALHRAGDPEHRAELLAAVDQARRLGDGHRLARAALALNMLGSPSAGAETDEEVVAVVEEALTALPEGESVLRARLLAVLAVELLWSDELDRRRALAAEAVELASAGPDPAVLARILYSCHLATSSADNLDERARTAQRLVTLGDELHDREAACRGHLIDADARIGLADGDGATAALDAADALALALKQPLFQWEVRMRRAGMALLEGDLDRAEAAIDETMRFGEERGVPPSQLLLVYGAQLLMLRAEQDRWDELERLLEGFVDLGPRLGANLLTNTYAAAGRTDEAARLLGPAVDAWLSYPRDLVWVPGTVLLARTIALLGDREAAARLRPLLEPYGGRMSWVVSVSCGPTDLGNALLAAVAGDVDAAERHAEAAVAVCRSMGARRWAERCETEVAAALDAGGASQASG